MKTWALANQKGGTGKTTTAIHLAASLAALGKRVLLVDLDPQAHATMGVGRDPEAELSIARVFRQESRMSDVIVTTSAGFHLAPGSIALAEFEELAERMLHPEQVLAGALEEVVPRYDWTLIDCSPRADGVLTANAIRAADTALLVVETGAFALQGALRAREIFRQLALDQGRQLDLRLVATMFDRRTRLGAEILIAMQMRFGAEMFNTAIRRSVRLGEAAAYGVPVQQLAPGSSAATDFDALGREVLALSRALSARESTSDQLLPNDPAPSERDTLPLTPAAPVPPVPHGPHDFAKSNRPGAAQQISSSPQPRI